MCCVLVVGGFGDVVVVWDVDVVVYVYLLLVLECL